MKDSWLDRPVLIYGPNKSGTTLLQCLLDGGSRMLVYPGELKLKAMYRHRHRSSRDRTNAFLQHGRGDFKYWLQMEVHPDRAPKARSVAQRTFGNLTPEDMLECFDQESYLAGLAALGGDGEPSDEEILKQDALSLRRALKNDSNGYRCWASKEVGGQPQLISEYFGSMFAGGRFVYVAREPRAVLRSAIRDRRRRLNQRLPLKDIARRCHAAQRFVHFYANRRLHGNSILVRYEDLVRSTEREMRRVTEFLGLPFEEIHTRPTILGRSVVVVTSSRETHEVFDATRTVWTQGLTLREKLAIRGFSLVSRWTVGLRGRGLAAYGDLDPLPR